MILTDAEGYTLRALKSASNNGKHVLYLVPIQEALSTDPLPYDAPEFSKMPQANCVSCGQKMPLQMLALHADECSVILQHIAWPVADSDDDDDESLHPEIVTRQITFLREYIQEATSDQLQKLMSFWTGWEVPSNSLQVNVCKGKFFKASTCSRTLMLPADILTMDEFSSTLQACANTASTGFGLV
ncbi:hypothetical protein IRJ41_007610 [Triplophysa rosa]|uniref:HECT domain-containing protein n=1 Tax=Triplophysa rosa TaxID=992332 RepID=A0A9W7T202_TRIRA|nr:hypothetical protein IRJ41_007610 [Triplophysa rosa]